jgi:tetratricopeptide (TPR) repeat protein
VIMVCQYSKTRLFLRDLLIAAALCGFAGCASTQHKPTAREDHQRADEASFAAGATRTPTPNTSYALSKLLVGQGRDRDALYVLVRILRDHPKFLPAYNEIAGIYLRSDRLDDAIEVLSTGLKHSPGDGVLLNNRGMCHFFKGDYANALESFAQAADRSPTNPIYRANRAAALGMLGRDREAEAEYRTVIGEFRAKSNVAILAKARKDQNIALARADAESNAKQASPSAPPQSGRPIELARPATRPAAKSAIPAPRTNG